MSESTGCLHSHIPKYQLIFLEMLQAINNSPPPLLCPMIEPHSVDLKGVGPNLVGVSERNAGEARPRALSQSAMHSFERGDRGNTQALAELAQVGSPAWSFSFSNTLTLHYFKFLKCKM